MVLFERKNVIRSNKIQPHVLIDTEHTGSNAHMRKTHCVDCGTYIDSVPREILNALEATRSASSNRSEELADWESRDTTITKKQIDLATRMMLEQVSRLSDGDYEQSMMVQLFPGLCWSCNCVLNCICFLSRAAHAFQSQPNTDFLRVVG